MPISFEALSAAVARPALSLSPKARLSKPAKPSPFVSPELRVLGEENQRIDVEVVFIEAPAAVGKSTLAKALSNRTGAPVLDLAVVPVSTQSLVGLLHSDFARGIGFNPVDAFHRGELPIIIDALDEGRLLSGEQSFERFLETTGELLQEVRAVKNKPKLIFLGRTDSIELTKLGLQMGGEFTFETLEVTFFDEVAARQLIDAYARAIALPDSAYVEHPEPCQQLVDAYFSSIGQALGLPKGTLWSNNEGRAFAGYAPVLAALGSLLAKFDNFVEVLNDLRTKGPQQAWAVIELVLKAILERERKQLTDQLGKVITGSVPTEAYDADEQLRLLSRVIHGYSAVPTGRVRLPDRDLATYNNMVEQRLAEHPFIRHREPANAVLGSMILAHAIYNDLLVLGDNTRLAPLSRQPFLWRSLSEKLQSHPDLLDGRYLGYVMNSHWNDPTRTQGMVKISAGTEEASARATIPMRDHRALEIDLMLPLWLYSQARDCEIDIGGHLKLCGAEVAGSGGSFSVRGRVQISCGSLEADADAVSFEGVAWVEADTVTNRARLEIHMAQEARVGWGGAFVTSYPWNRIPSTVETPYAVPHENVLEALLAECAARIPAGAAITLRPDYTNPNDDRLRWVDRHYQREFAALTKLMVLRGFASEESLSAKGEAKMHIRFALTWQDLLEATRNPESYPQYQEFLADARQAIA